MKGRRTRAAIAVALILGGLLALAWPSARRHVRAASLLADLSGGEPLEARVRELRLPGGMRARRYGSGEGARVVLVHGVHPGGIDEPRLVRFAEALARDGLVVITPELSALSEVRLDPRASTDLADACEAIARLEGRARVGVIGISIGGGLSLIAATRTESIGAILAIGAHHQIGRLARGWLEGGEAERYGAQVLAYAYADEYLAGVPDAEAAQAALSALIHEERPALEGLSVEARARVEPLLHGHEIAPVAPRLEEVVRAHASDLAALSPAGRVGSLGVPVFLLHGVGDPLVPSTESVRIHRELPASQLLRTPLLGHADRREVSLLEELEVVHFMAGALAAFDALSPPGG